MTLPPSNERNGYRTGFWAAFDRGIGLGVQTVDVRAEPDPKKNSESRLARASRHSSAKSLASCEIGPIRPPRRWRRFWLPGSPQLWLEITPG